MWEAGDCPSEAPKSLYASFPDIGPQKLHFPGAGPGDLISTNGM